MLGKLINYFRNMLKYIKRGGVVYVSVSQANRGDALRGKKVLITGGSSGFGYEMAKKFLQEGASVVITGRNQNKLDEAVKNLNNKNVFGLIWDISIANVAREKLNETVNILNGLDIVVNNAGVWTPKKWNQIEEDEWDKISDTNLKGLFFMCQAEAAILKNGTSVKKIINITSIEGLRGGFGPYHASKWGAKGITKGLAKELIKDNVIVNAIAPGMAITDINPSLPKNVQDNAFLDCQPTKRFVLVEEVAELALFLASDASNSIVGQIIAIDGGWTLN